MSDLERDLRAMLARRAGTPPSRTGDWQDLTVRMARRNRRSRRVMAGALAVVLIVGPLAGFAVARAVEDSDPSGEVTAGGRLGDADGGQISTSEGAAYASRSAAFGVLSGVPVEKLFRRTTGDDIAIRGFISQTNGGGSACQGDGWCPPVDCFPDAAIIGQLSTEAAVGIANGEHYQGVTTDLRLTGGGVFGASGEESPTRWITAQTSDRVAKVRVSFEGGGSDEMATVDGVAILAAPADPEKTGGTVEALDGAGAVVGTADAASAASHSISALGEVALGTALSSRQVIVGSAASGSGSASSWSESSASSSSSSAAGPSTTTVPSGAASTSAVPPGPGVAMPPEPRSECIAPPPTLPPPGEQPADPAAARAEIEHAFAISLDGGYGNDEEKRAVVEDSEELVDVMESLRNGTFAQQVKDATGKVTEIVFTSPTEAAVRYDINVANYSDFTGRIGKALFLDGRWKVARVTACADISLAGVSCPPK